MKIYTGWAPPGRIWGPWVTIGNLIGGPLTYRVDFDTISSTPATFDAEIRYWRDTLQKSDIVVGPGTHLFTAGTCVCVQRIRFRSHALGQMIRIKVKP